MSEPPRQLLFVQGAGAGTHDAWDDKLVDSLRRELGAGWEIHYPLMPAEDEPTYPAWAAAIREELSALRAGAIVVGHSVGATILVQALAEDPPETELAAIVLIAAPFVGAGGWPADEFELTDDLGERLPPGVPIHLFQGLDDDTVPAGHADRYAQAIPQVRVHRLPGRDHQLNDDLAEVARILRPSNGEP